MTEPQFILISGPNGAGKSTSASALIPSTVPYINADEIAKLLTDTTKSKEITAGRRFFEEWDRLESERRDFAIETTLASRSLAPRVKALIKTGYTFHLIFLWLPSEQLAIQRVEERVRAGGHSIPEETIRRRYRAGLINFFALYRPLADTWAMYRNLKPGEPELIAWGSNAVDSEIVMPEIWKQINEYRI